jgi:ethanolamine utilization protein EutA
VHTTELSGSTIFISDPEALPLRDIPSIRLTVTEDFQEVTAEISEKIGRFSLQGSCDLPAIVVPKEFGNGFYQIKGLVQAIVAALRKVKAKDSLVIICEDDIGKAFGNLLMNSLHNSRPVISIDQLTMKEGDYIDLGKPLYDGGVVPVVIKTLVFSNS